MQDSSVNWLYEEINNTMEQKVPIKVAQDIMSLIPEGIDNSLGDRIKITQVYTKAQYVTSLMLYDKEYSSRIHTYGVTEELLYSYNKITTGKFIDHRIRNNRGTYDVLKEKIQPGKLENDESNIYVIKRTEWDSNLFSGKIVYIDIIIYNRNNMFELARTKEGIETLERLKAAAKKGCETNGGES